jgi:hypothetical protein
LSERAVLARRGQVWALHIGSRYLTELGAGEIVNRNIRIKERDTVETLSRAVAVGSLAGVATTVVVALCGQRETGNPVAPINATSHVLWGDEAAAADAVDMKHTLPGVVINAGAGVFWACVQQLLLKRVPRTNGAAVASGVAVAALAYVVDYHLIPRRLSPGWELRVSGRSVALGFVALGASLALAALAGARR